MKLKHEHGNLSIGIILFGAIIGLTMMLNQSKKVEHALTTAKVRKVSLESEELSLYGFTVVRQLFNNASGQAGLSLSNDFDPSNLNAINMQQATGSFSTRLTLLSGRNLDVLAPDLLTRASSQMNAFFESTNFSKLDEKLTAIHMRIVDFETYPSGYGIRNLIFESSIQLDLQDKRNYTSRARIPVPLAPVNCQLTINGQTPSAPTLTIKQSIAGQAVAINANCSGHPMAAYLSVNQIQVGEAILPRVFQPIFQNYVVSSPGTYALNVKAIRADDMISLSQPLVLFIEAPVLVSAGDYRKCLYKCGCEWPDFADPNLCKGSSDFVNPFHNMKGLTELPAISGNPLNDKSSLDILNKWAYDHGAQNDGETHGAKLQGLLYPGNGYGTKLACSKVGGGGKWLTWAFDPNNNCEEEFVGSRGTIGCLTEGSLVMIGPGSYKPIETLTREDRIWNPQLSRYFSIKKLVHGPETKDLYTINVDGKVITMTYDHPVLTQRGYRQAAELKRDDLLLSGEIFKAIESITARVPAPGSEVWNLILDDAQEWHEHLLFIEGIAVGDLWMQQEMSEHSEHRRQ